MWNITFLIQHSRHSEATHTPFLRADASRVQPFVHSDKYNPAVHSVTELPSLATIPPQVHSYKYDIRRRCVVISSNNQKDGWFKPRENMDRSGNIQCTQAPIQRPRLAMRLDRTFGESAARPHHNWPSRYLLHCPKVDRFDCVFLQGHEWPKPPSGLRLITDRSI